MITCLLVDDEPHNVENLKQLIDRYLHQVVVKDVAYHADEAIEKILMHKPDLLFLDIQMPGKNGFELLSALPKIDFEVIFITAYDQYGIRAIKFSALDYLLKPVQTHELIQAVHKAEEKLLAKKRNLNLENLLDNLKSSRQDTPRIALPAAQETRYVSIADILRCRADNNYTEIYLKNGECLVVSRTLKEYEEMLGSYHFLRPHQSHLVNIHYIKSLLKEDGGTLEMTDGVKIPVSRQKREHIKQTLTAFISKT